MRIGDAAAQLGLATHVLRHWDDEGVVVPSRSPQGYREYDEEALTRLHIVRQCQEAGMSLPQIRQVLHRGEGGRAALIREHRAAVTRQIELLDRTRTFLDHVLTCRHSLMSRCDGCLAYVDAN